MYPNQKLKHTTTLGWRNKSKKWQTNNMKRKGDEGRQKRKRKKEIKQEKLWENRNKSLSLD